MKIIKYKKIGVGKYKVLFDSSELILYEDVIVKYKLLTLKDVDLKLLNIIMEENKYYEVLNSALKYIDIKMRSRKELENYLNKKEFDKNIIDKVIDELINKGYLSEKMYIKAYINDKINLSLYGPNKIKKELENLGFDEYLIDKYLNDIDKEVWNSRVDKIISKKVKLNKSSFNVFVNKLKMDLYNLGYSSNIEDKIDNFVVDDKDNLEKEYNKAYNKYNNKFEGDKLVNEIKGYLYRKRFDINQINILLDEKSRN